MKRSRALLSAFFLMGAASLSPAEASISDWHTTEGASIRVITTGAPDANGMLRGALEIDLKPGWKTYWKEPGEAGVPPQVEVRDKDAVSKVAIDFPAPAQFDDGSSRWTGYDHPVTLPLRFQLVHPGQLEAIDVRIFIGICEKICIPVEAVLTVDPTSDPDGFEDAALVDAAEKALPMRPTAKFGLGVIEKQSSDWTFHVNLPEGVTDAQLFLAGDGRYEFGSVKRENKDGAVVFRAHLTAMPANVTMDRLGFFTLTTSKGAVSGTFPLEF